jgi:co-chaperonin GroES (HSP10)
MAGVDIAKIKPGMGKALLRLIKGPEKTAGGIIIPDIAMEGQTVKPLDGDNRGEVVALGKDGYLCNNQRDFELDDFGRRIPSKVPDVKPGDVVRFSWHAGAAPDKYGDGIYFVRFQDIIAVEAAT